MSKKVNPKPSLTPIFVYGTLLSGEANHSLLEGCEFLGEVKTDFGYELVDFGWYPAMIIGDGQKQVTGELYLVSQRVLRAMDRLEGHPDYYRRVSISLEDGRMVQSYLFPRQNISGFSQIDSGSWRMRNRDKAIRPLQS